VVVVSGSEDKKICIDEDLVPTAKLRATDVKECVGTSSKHASNSRMGSGSRRLRNSDDFF